MASGNDDLDKNVGLIFFFFFLYPFQGAVFDMLGCVMWLVFFACVWVGFFLVFLILLILCGYFVNLIL